MPKRKIVLEENSDFDLITQLKLEKEKFLKTNSKKVTIGKDKKIKKKLSLFDKSNKGIESRQERDQFNKDPKTLKEREQLEISRKSLERKAKIYELLKRKGKEVFTKDGEEDEIKDKFGINILTEKFLVNFEQKGYNSDSDDESNNDNNNKGSNDEGDGEFMEIEDEFGRSRKILKSDFKNYENEYFLNDNNEPQLMTEDMKRERERIKWEEETLREIKMGLEHYSKDSETRQLGVGFYKFSQDLEERAKQMEELNKLRRETERIRKENGLDINNKESKNDNENDNDSDNENNRSIKLQRMKEKGLITNDQTKEVNEFLDSLIPSHLGEDSEEEEEGSNV